MKDDELLAEIRQRWDEGKAYWDPYYEACNANLAFVFGGDQWDPVAKAERTQAGLPSLTFNELAPMVHRVINKTVESRPQIGYLPVDSGADPETAEILSQCVRSIEYQSAADDVYRNSVTFASAGGLGWLRICSDYAPKSFYQDAYLESVVNPASVVVDPKFCKPDGSDIKWGIVYDEMPQDEFEERWPKAKVQDFTSPELTKWFTTIAGKKYVVIAEYFRVVEKSEKLYQLSNGESRFESEMQHDMVDVFGQPLQPLGERMAKRCVVEWYKTNGSEILERTEFPGDWVPLVPTFGVQYWDKGERKIQCVTHHAHQPQRAYNMGMSNYTEILAAAPKSPWMAAEGQLEGYEDEWERSAVDNTAVLTYKNVALGGSLAPAPQRVPPVVVPPALVDMVNKSQQAIQQATGIHEAFMGEASNERTGAAIQQRRMGTDLSIQHLTANFSSSVMHVGRILLACIRAYYDVPRVARLIGEDKQATTARVDPAMQQSYAEIQDRRGRVIDRVFNPNVGRFDVQATVRQGYDTRRQEAAQFFQELVRSNPALSQALGDLMVSTLDFPGAQEAAKRLKRAVPVALLDPAELDGDVVQQQQQQMQQMQQALQQYEEQIQQMQDQLEGLSKAAAKSDDENRRLQIENAKLAVQGEIKMIEQQIKAAELQLSQKEIAVEAQIKAEELKTKKAEVLLKMHQLEQQSEEKAEAGETAKASDSNMKDMLQSLKDTLEHLKQPKKNGALKLKVERDADGELVGGLLTDSEFDFDKVPGYNE